MRLPGAEELFRHTGQASEPADPTPGVSSAGRVNGEPRRTSMPNPQRSSGRVRHDEKMTVYVTADELLDLEHARLRLRREWGIGVDRGRVVREAVAIALADIERRGVESELVRRLSGP